MEMSLPDPAYVAPGPQLRMQQQIRFVTAASLFDGHDASINIIRRLLQDAGVEVIHLGHNRSVDEIVTSALQEDVHAIAVSSYQGGHVEFFKYLIDMLRERDGKDIKIFGGGGGVIVDAEIEELHAYGMTRIYTPADGQKMGLKGMIDDMLVRIKADLTAEIAIGGETTPSGDWRALARWITTLERHSANEEVAAGVIAAAEKCVKALS